jgi:hypothetical protein
MPRGPDVGIRIAQSVSILAILGLIFLKPKPFWSDPGHVFAAALALVAWLLIFSPIFWEHYQAYLAPFWGWVVYEATRSRARAVVGTLAILLAVAPWALLMRHLHIPRPPEFLAVTLLWSAVLMLALGVTALVRRGA